jgi:hypothetical protein
MQQSTTRWVLALTALIVLSVPRAVSVHGPQMNFSFATSYYYYSDDGSTLYTVVDGSDNSTGCQHGNYSTTGYANGPTGTVTQTTAGLYSTVGIPVDPGGFNFSWGSDLVLDCSCFGPGLDSGGGSSSNSSLPVPTTEYSIPNAWADTPRATVFKWRAQLTGNIFTGRTVRETNGGNDVDTCYDHYPNPGGGEMGVQGTSWPVDGASSYGDDGIGWIELAVLVYRAHNAAPCDFETDQRMQINQLGGNWVYYKTNRLKGGIDVTSVSSFRDGLQVSKGY